MEPSCPAPVTAVQLDDSAQCARVVAKVVGEPMAVDSAVLLDLQRKLAEAQALIASKADQVGN